MLPRFSISIFRISLLLLILLPATCLQELRAQPIPVGDLREEQLRIRQLLNGNDSLSISFSSRPVWKETYDDFLDTSRSVDSWWERNLEYAEREFSNTIRIGLYEPVFTNTHNTRLPVGENNGAAWYGKGLTSELQGGFYATSEYATLTFRPHLSYQQNLHFEVPRFVPRDSLGNVLYGADELGFGIDNPFRFGPDPYWTFNLGHSSFRLHYKGIEAGLSSEPLWWGPAVRYPLMLSNNAPGLKHAFLGTRKPISLPLNIGKFEFRWIWARPEDSEYFPKIDPGQRDERLVGLTNGRFMNGLNVIFSPSIVPNLHLGLIRVFHQYIPEEGLGLADYFDIFQAFQKETRHETIGNEGDDLKNQLASAYLRWVWPESNAEIYLEFFKEDHNWDLRDFLMEPRHNGAYTVGFQKIILSDWIDFFRVNAEINSLVPNRLDEVRHQAYYYTHSIVRQGHTNGGQVLGASIGPGSESQYLGVEGYFESGKVGLFIQRWVDNDHFHFEYDQANRINPNGDIWRHRVNLNIGSNVLYRTGPVILSGRIMWTKAFNYGRFDYGRFSGINFLTFEPHDVINLQFQLRVRYLLN